MEKLHEVFAYLSELFVATDPLNEKMNVLLGIATYSYKRLKEIYEHQLFNSISGRSCVRVLIEDYIMMKYLVNNEPSHDNIWRDYQLYGMGLYKLVLARHRESGVAEEQLQPAIKSDTAKISDIKSFFLINSSVKCKFF